MPSDDAVAVGKAASGDGHAVDEGSVGGSEVGDNPDALRLEGNLRMLTTYVEVVQDDVVAGFAADKHSTCGQVI